MKLKSRKNLLILIPVAGLAIGLSACGGPTSGTAKEAAAQGADTTSLENNQPLPHFNYSQERQNMIDIETAEANDVETTSFFMNYGVADPEGSCPSIGFGIPDSSSLSNPLQVHGNSDGSSTAIGQMDPTGIYAPLSSQGTFVICLDSSGSPYIDRIESQVNTAGGPAAWNYTKHMWELTGAPTASATGIGK